MASHGSSIFTSKMGTAEERAKKSSLLHFYFSVSKKKQHFYGCCCQYNPGMMMAWELSFSSLLPCFRPFFFVRNQDGFQIHKCHFTRSLFGAANASQFSTPPRVTNPHPFVFSFDFVISAQIFWRRTKRRQEGSRWHFQQSCHLIRTARYIFNSVCRLCRLNQERV